jgi:hypothetical protein
MYLDAAERTQLNHALSEAAPRFGGELARATAARGLAVTHPADGSTRPIPITATPVIVEPDELRRRARIAELISRATVKMSRWALTSTHREFLLGGMSPVERQLSEATFQGLELLATTRVDFFVGLLVRALEVNATIPAMQGYSDIAADTFLEIAGRHWGAPAELIARWQAQNGSNALALHRALLAGYERIRPRSTPRRIALLCRRNDAQITEQRYLAERFSSWGPPADVVHPDQLSGVTDVRAGGHVYDLVYRHLFVRRLDDPGPGTDFVRALLAEPNGTRAVVLNPPASQVEAKAVFAMLSEALVDPKLARAADLDADELEAIVQSVPWTRQFRGSTLCEQVAADPDRYVLKRSWDYGGRAVFIGGTRREPHFADRVRAAFGADLDWNGLCAAAVLDSRGGGFVVQEVVETQPEQHVLCTGTDSRSTSMFVDFSAYASVGLEEQPRWGGVCRGSPSQIVNIVGGGGVLPLLSADVARSLLLAYRAQLR